MAEKLKSTRSRIGDKMAKRSSKPAAKAREPERFTCLGIAFKNNDQLKTNTGPQMESAKIEFKVI